MNEVIEVHVKFGGKTHLVGHLRYLGKANRKSSLFEYSDSWLSHHKAFALDPANLQLTTRQHYWTSEKTALPGAIRDCAPDSWGRTLIRRAFQRMGHNRSLSKLDYLFATNDYTRVGALRFTREGESDFCRNIGQRTVLPSASLPALLNAAMAVQTNTESTEDLRLLLDEGSPLGGARPKSAVINNEGSLAIAKFPNPDDDYSIPHGEVLALMLADKAGINAAKGNLQMVGSLPVALIQRFDRVCEERIPFLSAMSLLGLQDGDSATYTDIAQCIRMYSTSPINDLHELWRRIVFGVMISNLDDHLRNHGFIYAGNNQWRLSPAYDLNPMPRNKKARELTTWISEEGPDADLELAYAAAPYFALKPDTAKSIVADVALAIESWHEIALRLGMSKADMDIYETAISVKV
ncbi:MAG: type II toxin-antitoxin system HipA family toxin [Rhodothermaceae bacterium]|nr:type II toxin-antitoxin system HipA family toxin [Rhodothermaceae bacterium]MXX59857.1 type II toxin-antitoxin system HipA family toxin [Rhodothermaceae bacterium]MYD18575.1 type II toxin-antitoxin system HipA family toxin [Rhodothermaceae bacterium]MYD56752.1 type II toxin-antitoxin system HipA family toxin [Rhodothermaceae bacterium]MYI42726.1 type II toxin-antitoxin system HipA family toxin [Rhodothermaceae bacterium]